MNRLSFKIIIHVFLIIILSYSHCFAREDIIERIDIDYQKGLITLDEALLYKVYAIEGSPEEFNEIPEKYKEGKWGVATFPMIIFEDVESNWHLLNEETKKKLAPHMIKPGETMTKIKTSVGVETIKFSPPIAGFPRIYDTEHFHIHYTTDPNDSNRIVYDAGDNNGFRDWQKFTDWNGNNFWDSNFDEPFVDCNENGKWDITTEEPYTDWNENDMYDSSLDEFTDWNENNSYDSSLDEPYEDSNGNGKYDPGETFTDYNDSGTRDTGLSEPVIADYNGNGQYELGLSEPFTDYNENGVQDNGIQEPSGDDVGRDGDPNTIDADGSQGNGIADEGEPEGSLFGAAIWGIEIYENKRE